MRYIYCVLCACMHIYCTLCALLYPPLTFFSVSDGMFKGIYHGKKCHAADIPAVTGGSLKESREALEIA
ncbi:hypothetical protein GQ55_1G184300 [Panicum hallii var. hallii]|uniref:Uncharacterized protein n=1 Tax=Panicum hallii var. hallii TaxID=1504633 RepID=A0A2T7F662_9POAL|nr:hypothetical protein GQ55_1G184300 [Panicum hallii var. hallii]